MLIVGGALGAVWWEVWACVLLGGLYHMGNSGTFEAGLDILGTPFT